MMSLSWWLTYVATSFVFSLSPGSGAVNTASIGISHGFRTALVSIVGLQAGLAVHILIVGVGLGTLLAHSPRLFTALRLFGAGYLIWLGIRQILHAGVLRLERARTLSHAALVKQSLLVNLTNPKTILFLAALFPQFLIQGQPQTPQYMVLAATTLIMDALVMGFYAAVSGHFSRFISTPYRLTCMHRLFGALFVLIGILLALAR